MDETRDGVRQQLRAVIQETAERRHAELEAASSTDFADAILARWDLTEKPVVTAEELGRMARNASHKGSLVRVESRNDMIGLHLLAQLREAGLRIVRAEDGRR